MLFYWFQKRFQFITVKKKGTAPKDMLTFLSLCLFAV